MTLTTLLAAPPPARQPFDSAALKARQWGAWSAGDYAVVGTTLQIVGEQLCETLDLRAGSRVLDVAAGNGNAALAAARRWCEVTATDYVPALLDRAGDRADADGLSLNLQVADAEALPFANESFDAVVSTFGVMFTPDQEGAAAELVRVCRPTGAIGLANWTPDGFIGQLFAIIGRHLPPPAGAPSPARWGTDKGLAELFTPHGCSVRSLKREFVLRYRSPEHWLQVFATFYGPVLKALNALSPEARVALECDLLAAIGRFNRSGDGTMIVPSAYLETIVMRR
jgi:SAM-dependent methyltransferase